jgi:hypothetical protein
VKYRMETIAEASPVACPKPITSAAPLVLRRTDPRTTVMDA